MGEEQRGWDALQKPSPGFVRDEMRLTRASLGCGCSLLSDALPSTLILPPPPFERGECPWGPPGCSSNPLGTEAGQVARSYLALWAGARAGSWVPHGPQRWTGSCRPVGARARGRESRTSSQGITQKEVRRLDVREGMGGWWGRSLEGGGESQGQDAE